MRTIFGVKPGEAILFLVCAVIYIVLIVGIWNTGFFGAFPSIADDVYGNLPFLKDLFGDFPAQSLSKLFVATTLYILAVVYAIISIAISPYRTYLPQFIVLGGLSFLAWVALNFWVISGFLNADATVLYGAITVGLLIIWGGGLMRFVSRLHDPTALFLVRLGLGLSCFIALVQLISLATPGWRSPFQGIPVLYTLTLNAMVGMFLAGAGGNMLWRERREQVLAAGRKKR